MRIEEITKGKTLVNDEQIYIIDKTKFNLLMDDPFIDEIYVGGEGILKLIWGLNEFVLKYPEFLLGIYKFKIGAIKTKWMFIVLYQIESGWQRVHIERVKCDKCNWIGEIANPTEPSLYDTVKNRFEILDRVWIIPKKPCPNCGEGLQRYAIWTEPINNE